VRCSPDERGCRSISSAVSRSEPWSATVMEPLYPAFEHLF
jgi:hypothetical protein